MPPKAVVGFSETSARSNASPHGSLAELNSDKQPSQRLSLLPLSLPRNSLLQPGVVVSALNPSTGKLRQEDGEFEANTGYRVN